MRSFAALLLAGTGALAGAQTFLGPTPYLQASDSPWTGVSFDYFHLDDIEDKALNTPGATLASGIVTSSSFGPGLTDSVDGDDGLIDGIGAGESLFANGPIRINFSEAVLGTLPTHAGIVWTDGVTGGTFEALDRNGSSLGTISGTHASSGFTGQTDEDRFYGVEYQDGISAIIIRSPGSAVEADHVQYGYAPVPEPGIMAALGLGALALRRRRASSK